MLDLLEDKIEIEATEALEVQRANSDDDHDLRMLRKHSKGSFDSHVVSAKLRLIQLVQAFDKKRFAYDTLLGYA